jgi:hypothetical protein
MTSKRLLPSQEKNKQTQMEQYIFAVQRIVGTSKVNGHEETLPMLLYLKKY